ncbi:MAG TPA: enoyl-CoA hydratase-related protein [Bryobacteraceae bacterium]|nr:enoyl-CoA hydratase-related protein [Bryobacteraceae bacterium]
MGFGAAHAESGSGQQEAGLQTQYETLAVVRPEERLLVVMLNRPERSNALNTQMGRDLLAVFSGLYVDSGGIRCIVLTGSGNKAFCAGGDLKQRHEMSNQDWQQQHAVFEQHTLAMLDCPIPILAAVNGAAYGGGLEMVLCADFIYAARSARFALTETSLGIMPGAAGTQNLPRACGVRRAKEIIFTAEPFTAQQAFEWGIVNKICDDKALMTDTLATARKIAANAPLAVRQAKKAIGMAAGLDLKSGYAFEIEAYNRLVPTRDRLEGVRAFNEKRKPDFKGE